MLLNCSIVNCVRKRIDESKQIPNYSSYLVLPNEGLVYSLKQHKFIGGPNNTGYWNCALTADDGKVWGTKVHRVIWMAVNGEIPEGMQVNHIDEDKNNNCIFNLNLMTAKENCNWGTRNERAGKASGKARLGKPLTDECKKNMSKAQMNNSYTSIPVGAYKNEELIMSFPSMGEAERNGFSQSHISSCCLGKRKTHRGYEWRYI